MPRRRPTAAPPLTANQRAQLATLEDLARGDTAAVVRRYEAMCRHVARRFLRQLPTRTDYDDLLQECRFAVLRCCPAYSPDRGTTFLTFAYKAAFFAALNYLDVEHRGGWKGLGKHGVKPATLTEVVDAHGERVSAAALAADDRPPPPEHWPDALWRRALAALTPRQRDVLVCRLQLGLTLDECGRLFGVVKERVRQIETAAVKKLREQWGGRPEDLGE